MMQNVFFISFSLMVAVTQSRLHRFRRIHELPSDEDDFLYWKDKDAKPCVPFRAFYRGCNKCVCGADGIRSCTRIECGDSKEIIKIDIASNEEDNFDPHQHLDEKAETPALKPKRRSFQRLELDSEENSHETVQRRKRKPMRIWRHRTRKDTRTNKDLDIDDVSKDHIKIF